MPSALLAEEEEDDITGADNASVAMLSARCGRLTSRWWWVSHGFLGFVTGYSISCIR